MNTNTAIFNKELSPRLRRGDNSLRMAAQSAVILNL